VSFAILKSVNDREVPSLRRGGTNSPFLVSASFLDACNPRGESSEVRNGLLGGIVSTFSRSSFPAWSASICRCLLAGHRYSIIRLPTRASICNRIGCKDNSNDSYMVIPPTGGRTVQLARRNNPLCKWGYTRLISIIKWPRTLTSGWLGGSSYFDRISAQSACREPSNACKFPTVRLFPV